jgi:hypothetical protein
MPIAGIEKSKNPLGFVDRLLDDERDSNLHFGDVRFWRHLEYIDTPQIYRTKSLEYRTMKLMFFEAVFYVIFLGMLTLFIVQTRPETVYEAGRQQLDYWGDCKRGPGGARGAGGCKFDEVNDADSFMDWFRLDFIPKAFTSGELYHTIGDTTSVFRLQSGIAPWEPRYVGDTETVILLGSVRLRQLRVQYDKDCSIKDEFASIHPECFAQFSEGIQSRLSWAPTWTPSHLRHHFEWSSANRTEMTEATGQTASYPGDGFYFDLPLNKTGAQTRVLELREWKWLDKRTRAVIIEYSTLSPNVNVLVHNRMLFEFPATGGLISRHEAFPFRTVNLSLSLMQVDDTLSFACLLMTCSLHLVFFVYFAFLLYQNGFAFFLYFWSWIDLGIIVFFLMCVSTNLSIWAKAATMPDLAPETIGDPEMFFPIGHLVPRIELASGLLSILGLLSWLKVLKYFTLMGGLRNQAFVRIVERCFYNLILFGGLLVVVLFGFAAAFHIGYGGERDLFSTLIGSFVACVVAPAGGVSLKAIFMAEDFLGPMLVVAYFIVIFLLLLNTFMAICVDTYSVCMYELTEVNKITQNSPTSIFLWTYFNSLRAVKLVGKETEEVKGLPDEQSIPFTSLPEAVSSRYLETKERMTNILMNAEMEIENARLARLRAQGLEDTAAAQPRISLAHMLEDSPNDYAGKTAEEAIQEEMASITVKRVQLQRMLEDDPVLREICGTDRAIDVMRRFRVQESGVDPYEAVQALQAKITKLLAEIESKGMKLSFNEMDTLQTVSTELHSALTDSQKEWRAELLSVLQMATLLSKALVTLTRKIEMVQMNHKECAQRVGPPK